MLNPELLFIKGPVKLTQSQIKVVDYLLDHADEVPFMTASQLGRELGLSDATVVRLAQTLGFDGFRELKDHLRGRLMARLDTVSRMERTVGQVRSVEDVITAVMQADLANLSRTAENVSFKTLIASAQAIQKAEEVQVIGLRSAHALAQFLASALRFLGRRVSLLSPGIGEMWSDVSSLGRRSVLVAISFPRYTRVTVEAAEAAREAGATVISITDSALSPLAAHSNHLLAAQCRTDSFVESFVAALSILNALVTSVAFMDGQKTLERLRRMERLWEEKNIYFQTEQRALPSWARRARKRLAG